MSAHVEWVSAKGTEVEVFGPEAGFTDSYGTGLDEGNIAISLGGDDLVVIEGTEAQLRALLGRIEDAIDSYGEG